MRKLLLVVLLIAASCFAKDAGVLGRTLAAGGTTSINRIEWVGAASLGSQTFTVNLGTNTTANELVIIIVRMSFASGACTAPTVSDPASTIYTNLYKSVDAFNYCNQFWYKCNVVSGVSSVSVNLGTGNTSGGAIVGHFTGLASTGCLDQSANPPGIGASSPWSSSTVTTTTANQLLVGPISASINAYNVGIDDSYTASGSWTKRFLICGSGAGATCDIKSTSLDGANGSLIAVADQIVSSIQTNIASTGTNNGSANTYFNYPSIATFKQ